MAKLIPLTQGKFAIVDDSDYGWAMQWKWYAVRGKNTWYAVRTEGKEPNRKQVFLHREIMKAPDEIMVDHWDGDGLNNQRQNLRLATNAENMQNRGPAASNTSGFKGVSWFARNNKWKAGIEANGEKIHLGYFTDIIEAARAYDAAALKHHGAFAWFNFPEEQT